MILTVTDNHYGLLS